VPEAATGDELAVDRWPDGPVLITGATGLIGGALAHHLLLADVAVRVLLRPGRDPEPWRRLGAAVVIGDVTDPKAMTHACEGCRSVLHAAAVTRRTPGGRRESWRVNAEGPAIVARAACAAGVERMVHCSTSGVHGPLRRWPIDEDAPQRPDSIYRRSKAAGEQRLRRATASGNGPQVVIARICSVTGPGAGHTWGSLIRSVRDGRARLLGRGDRPIHLVDIDDVCQGLVRCLTEPVAAGRTYFIAAAEPTPVTELMRCFAEALGIEFAAARWPRQPIAGLALAAARFGGWVGCEPGILHSLSFLAAARAYRIDRARADLGYQPVFDLREMIDRTLRRADPQPQPLHARSASAPHAAAMPREATP